MIIAISGKIGTGKDLVANIIKYLDADDVSPHCYQRLINGEDITGYHNSTFRVVKFADKIKEAVALILNVPVSKLEDRSFKEAPLPESFWSWRDTRIATPIVTGKHNSIEELQRVTNLKLENSNLKMKDQLDYAKRQIMVTKRIVLDK